MDPDDQGTRRAPEGSSEQRQAPEQDIFIPPEGMVPLSRGAPERKLKRIDRYNRRARVTGYEELTPTGTVRISYEVVDEQAFSFKPGQFIGIQAEVEELGLRKTPYCIVSPPNEERTFQLLIRLVPEGPLSCYLASLGVGDEIKFRGPTGRSMVPKEEDTELILVATGVGVGPFLSLVPYLHSLGIQRPMRLFWGLRLEEDICLLDELDDLVRQYEGFSYHISLSQPPPAWSGLRGRVTETAPPQLESLGGKHFYLVGNGAMIEEMRMALSDLGVFRELIYEEPYFNARHKPDSEALARVRQRFVARDLNSPLAQREAFEREKEEREKGEREKGEESESVTDIWRSAGLLP